MTWNDLFKFIHVAASIAWVGGGLVFVGLHAMESRKGDPAAVLRVYKTLLPYANRVFMQAAIVALVSGIAMLLVGPYSIWDAWLVLGILGFAVTGYLGGAQLGPRVNKLVELEAKEGASPATMAVMAEIARISRFDIILMFTVVADMVIKPLLWSNWLVVILFLAIVGAAGYYFLAPILRRPATPPPAVSV